MWRLAYSDGNRVREVTKERVLYCPYTVMSLNNLYISSHLLLACTQERRIYVWDLSREGEKAYQIIELEDIYGGRAAKTIQ